MTKDQFFNDFINGIKIKIKDRNECFFFQNVCFEFGVRVHSQMEDEIQEPIAYNISDEYPEYKGKSFAKDMDNLCIYGNGTKLQQSAFYHFETLKEITFTDFETAYNSIQ